MVEDMALLLVGNDDLGKGLAMGLLTDSQVLEFNLQQVLSALAFEHYIHAIGFLVPSSLAEIAIAKLLLVFLFFAVHTLC